MSLFDNFKNKSVFVTGHTGFKGAWLCQWLTKLGANVAGYALAAPTDPSLFEVLGLGARIKDTRGDVRDRARLTAAVKDARPDVIFHMAAQPLVLDSYEDPVGTFETNVMGTANLLEAVRNTGHACVVIVVTSDKSYAPSDSGKAFIEEDRLGGKDPYSASKAATELVVSSYRDSFFGRDGRVRLASVRAGNVIGGGDWARNRILTDAVMALAAQKPIPVRNPKHVRPWQHVLEPLSGYMNVAAKLALATESEVVALADAWNFGPVPGQPRTVQEVVEGLIAAWGRGEWQDLSKPGAPLETKLLNISPEKARVRLGWAPVFDFDRTVRETAVWYRAWAEGGGDLRALTDRQIAEYTQAARAQKLAWAV